MISTSISNCKNRQRLREMVNKHCETESILSLGRVRFTTVTVVNIWNTSSIFLLWKCQGTWVIFKNCKNLLDLTGFFNELLLLTLLIRLRIFQQISLPIKCNFNLFYTLKTIAFWQGSWVYCKLKPVEKVGSAPVVSWVWSSFSA